MADKNCLLISFATPLGLFCELAIVTKLNEEATLRERLATAATPAAKGSDSCHRSTTIHSPAKLCANRSRE